MKKTLKEKEEKKIRQSIELKRGQKRITANMYEEMCTKRKKMKKT